MKQISSPKPLKKRLRRTLRLFLPVKSSGRTMRLHQTSIIPLKLPKAANVYSIRLLSIRILFSVTKWDSSSTCIGMTWLDERKAEKTYLSKFCFPVLLNSDFSIQFRLGRFFWQSIFNEFDLSTIWRETLVPEARNPPILHGHQSTKESSE